MANRKGLRPRWGVYASNIKDLIGLGIGVQDALKLNPDETKERILGSQPCLEVFVSKDKANDLKKLLDKDGFATLEVKRVMVAKNRSA
jgi:predicted P-loop ATPase/GTPase